jgi:hypothetical protein
MRAFGLVFGVLSLSVFTQAPAFAYSADSVASDPCHEEISVEAVRQLRARLANAPALAAQTRDERALLDDLPFDIGGRLRDVGAASLLLGNRNVDLKSNEPDELTELAILHGRPSVQREHCLLHPDQDMPGGTEAALAACKAYIRSAVASALQGLTAAGNPDPQNRISANVYLDLRGALKVDVPRYYFEMGRALHTLQDGFSHTFRVPGDPRTVSVVLNYVDAIDDDHYRESRDGPPHSSELDRCRGLDLLRVERLRLAAESSAELLVATLDPTIPLSERLSASDAVLDRYLSAESPESQAARGFPEGCNAANHWCNAPEVKYADSRGCSVAPLGDGSTTSRLGLFFGTAVFAGVWRRRRADRSRRRMSLDSAFRATGSGLRAPGAILAIVLLSLPARAQVFEDPDIPDHVEDEPEQEEDEPEASVGYEGELSDPVVEDTSPVSDDRQPFPFGAHVRGSIAAENSALAVALGLRYRVSSHFLVGLDGEWNPFWSFTRKRIRAGVANAYATAVVRFPLDFQRVNLRSTLHFGASRMLFDLVGVPEGSTGPFVGFNLLGLDYELSRSVYLVIEPAQIAIPIPKLKGVPFAYPQYRMTLGLQFGS